MENIPLATSTNSGRPLNLITPPPDVEADYLECPRYPLHYYASDQREEHDALCHFVEPSWMDCIGSEEDKLAVRKKAVACYLERCTEIDADLLRYADYERVKWSAYREQLRRFLKKSFELAFVDFMRKHRPSSPFTDRFAKATSSEDFWSCYFSVVNWMRDELSPLIDSVFSMWNSLANTTSMDDVLNNIFALIELLDKMRREDLQETLIEMNNMFGLNYEFLKERHQSRHFRAQKHVHFQ